MQKGETISGPSYFSIFFSLRKFVENHAPGSLISNFYISYPCNSNNLEVFYIHVDMTSSLDRSKGRERGLNLALFFDPKANSINK